MKLNLSRLLVILAVAMVLGAPAYAQSVSIRARVPFDFMLGDKVYAAGEYSIQSLDSYSNSLFIRNGRVEASAVTLSRPTTSLEPAKKSVLVFHRVGNTYFLSEVWCADSRVGRDFPRSRAESKMAMTETKATTVIIAANIIH